MKPIILGMSNPHRSKVPALSPRLPGTAGWRLWRMMSDWCGISQAEYERAFDRRNLEDGLLRIRPGSTVVVLGDEVRRYLGLRKVFIHPQVVGGTTFRCIPHPSGRCLWYNDDLCRNLVAMMLEDLCIGSTARRRTATSLQARSSSRQSCEPPRRHLAGAR